MSGSLFICYDRKVTYCSTESILEVSPRDNKKYITSLWILEKPYVHEGTYSTTVTPHQLFHAQNLD